MLRSNPEQNLVIGVNTLMHLQRPDQPHRPLGRTFQFAAGLIDVANKNRLDVNRVVTPLVVHEGHSVIGIGQQSIAVRHGRGGETVTKLHYESLDDPARREAVHDLQVEDVAVLRHFLGDYTPKSVPHTTPVIRNTNGAEIASITQEFVPGGTDLFGPDREVTDEAKALAAVHPEVVGKIHNLSASADDMRKATGSYPDFLEGNIKLVEGDEGVSPVILDVGLLGSRFDEYWQADAATRLDDYMTAQASVRQTFA